MFVGVDHAAGGISTDEDVAPVAWCGQGDLAEMA
jgi:hypothetical protein